MISIMIEMNIGAMDAHGGHHFTQVWKIAELSSKSQNRNYLIGWSEVGRKRKDTLDLENFIHLHMCEIKIVGYSWNCK